MPYTIIPPQDPGTGTVAPGDLTGFTATRIPFGSAAGGLEDVADLTYDKTTHDLTLSVAESGGIVQATLANASNTASSGAQLRVQVAGTSATGDATTQWSVSGGAVFTAGIDVSTTNKDFHISRTATLGTAATSQISFSGNSNQMLIGSSGGALTFISGQRLRINATGTGNSIAVFTENHSLLLGPSFATDVASTTLAIGAGKTIASAAGAVWDATDVTASTATLSGAVNITTATGFNLSVLRAPTISAASALTVTHAATLAIGGAPIAAGAGPATITNAYALWVQSGNVAISSGVLTVGTTAADTNYAALFGRAQSTDGIKCIGTNFGLMEVYGGSARLNVYAVQASSTRLGQTSTFIASLETVGANILLIGTPTSVPLRLCTNATSRLDISGAGVITTWDGATVSVGTTTGIKLGVATTEKIGFYNTTPVVQQTRGATLTNNVTVGGTNDTIADFAGALYATDATTIRDDIYQLARIVRQHDVALRALGLES